MGETIILSLLLLSKKALDKLLEKGIAIAVAATRKDNKYDYRYQVTDWDHKDEISLKDKKDETNQREGS